ncbi:MAG: IS630 family transposase [Deltaproteobacteria bacterium]|jgi:transposase|nr:IS630 family transposase [Deltaproteobacteria bacterium]
MKKSDFHYPHKEVNKKLTVDNSYIKDIIMVIINFLACYASVTVAKQLIITIFIALNVNNNTISQIVNVSTRTVRNIKNKIASGDIGNIFSIKKNGKKNGRKRKLEHIKQDIINEIEAKNYHNLKQIVNMIENKFSIKVSESTVSRFLKSNNIKRLKCGSFPAKADVKKQREFCEHVLLPLIKRATSGSVKLLFMDASHFVMGNDYIGYVYSKSRRFITTFSGRMRYNVLGALDFTTKQITTVSNDTYITATQVCELLKKIAALYVDKPVHIILDNAKYQKCKTVIETATQLGINLIFIPPYSPNLNLIERFWKHVKSQLSIKYFDKFSLFSETIDSIINNADKDDKIVLDSLITGNLQLFDDFESIDNTTYIKK